jgi:hypothetical protein
MKGGDERNPRGKMAAMGHLQTNRSSLAEESFCFSITDHPIGESKRSATDGQR